MKIEKTVFTNYIVDSNFLKNELTPSLEKNVVFYSSLEEEVVVNPPAFYSKSYATKQLNTASIYTSYDYQHDECVTDWLSAISKIDFNERIDRLTLENWGNNFHDLLFEQCQNKSTWRNLLSQIDNVLADYKYDYEQNTAHGQSPTMANPAVWSIINLLYLIPVFTIHNPQLDIDADTGYFTATFETGGAEILSVLITDKNEIHYSWVEDGYKIVKFTGTFKIRDKRDFLKFKRFLAVLQK